MDRQKKKNACNKGGSPRCCIKDSHPNVLKMERRGSREERIRKGSQASDALEHRAWE
jgi:hypothetical protein